MEKEKELCMTPVDLAAGGGTAAVKSPGSLPGPGASKAFRAPDQMHGNPESDGFLQPTRGTHGSECPGESQPFEILPEISPYLPSQQREQFSQILPLLEMMQLFSSMNQEGETSAPADLFSSLLSRNSRPYFPCSPSRKLKKEAQRQMDKNWTRNSIPPEHRPGQN
ncbi:MAG: hypothetical protein ACLR2E_05935 [Lachnospiraceae bacterium]